MTETDFKNQAIADNTLEETKAKRTVLARVYVGTSQSFNSATETKVEFDAENYDLGNDFDNTTNYDFTCPYNGYYRVHSKLLLSVGADQDNIRLFIYRNASKVTEQRMYTSGTAAQSIDITDIVSCSVNDTLEIRITNYDNNDTVNASSVYSYATFEYLGNS